MEFLTVAHSLTNFLFMGCWNKDGCTASLGQAAVARAIRREPVGIPLFLGGDNIYPDKHDGKKTYPPQRVEEGVACLIRGAPRQIYAALGNHNIARKDVLEAELALGLWTIRPQSYCIQFTNRAVVVLNSNPLDETELGEDTAHVLEALEQAIAHLKKSRIPYILMMHHPLIAFKKKAYYLMPQHAELLNRLVVYPPEIVLVADTHNYQNGIVTWHGIPIRQIVVGTGGADLDPIAALGSNRRLGELKAVDFAGKYIVEDAMVAHGYLRVSQHDTEFVEVRSSASRSPTRKSKRR